MSAGTLSALPSGPDVRALVDGLLDRGVTVSEEPRPVLLGREVAVVASYVDDAGAVRAVVLLDLALAGALGGALALVPPSRVVDATAAGQVPEDLADNAREVLNVAASLFSCEDVHLKLRTVDVAPAPADATAVAFLRRPGRRRDVRVDVPGYGTGVLAVLLDA